MNLQPFRHSTNDHVLLHFQMGYLEAKSVPACLRNHYEKLLFPYDVFQSGLMTGEDTGPKVRVKEATPVTLSVAHVKLFNFHLEAVLTICLHSYGALSCFSSCGIRGLYFTMRKA